MSETTNNEKFLEVQKPFFKNGLRFACPRIIEEKENKI